MVCPCRDCERRRIGCHAECGEYKAWDTENRKARKTRMDEAESKTIREGMRKNMVRKASRIRQGREK